MKASLALLCTALLVLVSSAPSRRAPPSYIDDGDAAISYGDAGAWSHITGQSAFFDGTYSYSNAADASYTYQFSGGETGFTISGSRKADRGYFAVFLDGDFLGLGDAYDPLNTNGDGTPSPMFSYTGTFTAPHLLTVANIGEDPRLGKTGYLFLDYLQVDY